MALKHKPVAVQTAANTAVVLAVVFAVLIGITLSIDNLADLKRTLIVVLLVLWPVLVTINAFINGRRFQPLTQIADAVSAIGQGNLTTHIAVEPGLTELNTRNQFHLLAMRINVMTEQFRGIVSDAVASAHAIDAAASTVHDTASHVAGASAQQSDAASAAAAAIEQLSGSVSQVADQARSARELSHSANQLASQGGEAVHQAVSEMRAIATSVGVLTEVVASLGQRSHEISGILGTIKDIADQTNLLALNASIEAARAGEAGRGFAVVADEVRKLAENTTQATRRIGETIAAIESDSDNAMRSMQGAAAQVESGVALASGVGEQMREIIASTSQAVTVVGDIAVSTGEQSHSSADIASGVERIADMATRNAVAVQQAAGELAKLAESAGKLRASVDRFQI